jgi:hypothetical protein
MKKKSDESAFLTTRFLTGLFFTLGTAFLIAFGSGAFARALSQQREIRSPTRKHIPAAGFEVRQPSQPFWEQTNGPQGGDGMAMVRNANGDVFVGTQGGGVFRSTDNAETWTGINNGLTATNVRALAVSPVDYTDSYR